MHFHNIYLLQRSIISEKYQVFIKFLVMADSQNMLVTLQSYFLQITKRIVIKQVNKEFIFQKIKSKLNKILP
uniref:Uncharacterized protein n=1 Tax=Ailuropoda melanoleuca TaxID=9646 RepID=A0A7N5P1S8_AILME